MHPSSAPNSGTTSALLAAAISGNVRAAQRALASGAARDVQNAEGFTALCIAAECGKMGRVVRVKVHGYNPDGVVQIRFKEPEEADKCVEVMHGRFFARRQIEAAKYDGYTKYHVDPPKETAEDEKKRLEAYAAALEEEEER